MDLDKILGNFKKKAESIYRNSSELNKLVSSVREALKDNDSLRGALEEIELFIDMIRDYVDGDYRDIREGSIILVIAGLLYIVSPIDIVPDFILGGYLDDLLIIYLIVKIISDEIASYKEWKTDKRFNSYNLEEYPGDYQDEVYYYFEDDDEE